MESLEEPIDRHCTPFVKHYLYLSLNTVMIRFSARGAYLPRLPKGRRLLGTGHLFFFKKKSRMCRIKLRCLFEKAQETGKGTCRLRILPG